MLNDREEQGSSPQQGSPEQTAKAGSWGEGAQFLLTAAAAIIVLFGLREARSLIVPIMMAVFLAIISYSVTDMLRKRLRFPHWLAVFATMAVDCGILYAIMALIRFLAMDMKNTLQSEVMSKFQEKFNSAMAQMDTWGLGEQARQIANSPEQILDPQQILSGAQAVTSQMVSLLSVTTLVLILMTFLLGEAPLFMRNFRGLPNSIQGKSKVISALKGIQRYLFIKTIASFSTGLLVWGLCAAMQVPFAFLWGVVACVLNYIPTIGSIVAAIPAILLALLLNDLGNAFIVALGYIIINCTIGNGIEPLFLGKQFGIATTVVLLSVLLWGWVWGPCGMLLAVPITVLLKLALENSRDLYWMAAIIDDNNKPSKKQP